MHISFDDGCVRFGRSDGSAWGNAEIIDCGASQAAGSSLAFDSMGTPYVSYVVDSSELRVAHFDDAAWQIESVDLDSFCEQFTSLALDPVTELPSVSYADFTGNHDDIKFARKVAP